jgi:hypothetical protein
MFNIGDLVKHSIYKCYGIIINKDDRSLDDSPTYAYYVTWVEDEFTPKSWELSQDLILAAGVNDEQHI